jgi:hypothetical protein
MNGFPEKHPWMTFFIVIVGITGAVAVAQSFSPAVTKVAGVPRPLAGVGGRKLPPKPAGT